MRVRAQVGLRTAAGSIFWSGLKDQECGRSAALTVAGAAEADGRRAGVGTPSSRAQTKATARRMIRTDSKFSMDFSGSDSTEDREIVNPGTLFSQRGVRLCRAREGDAMVTALLQDMFRTGVAGKDFFGHRWNTDQTRI